MHLEPLRVRRVLSRLHHIRSTIATWLDSGLSRVLGVAINLGIETGEDGVRTEAI